MGQAAQKKRKKNQEVWEVLGVSEGVQGGLKVWGDLAEAQSQGWAQQAQQPQAVGAGLEKLYCLNLHSPQTWTTRSPAGAITLNKDL